MEKTVYTLEMPQWCLIMNNFKLKQAEILVNTIMGSRLVKHLSFQGYANISFAEDDNVHKHAIVTELEQFNRNKANALVFNICEQDPEFPKYFDKLYVFYNEEKIGNYGYMFYNIETHEVSLTHTIDFNKGHLCVRLNESFDYFRRKESLDKYIAEKKKLSA